MISIRLERCGSSVMSHRKSVGSCGDGISNALSLEESRMVVRRGERVSDEHDCMEDVAFKFEAVRLSAPPKRLKSIKSTSASAREGYNQNGSKSLQKFK